MHKERFGSVDTLNAQRREKVRGMVEARTPGPRWPSIAAAIAAVVYLLAAALR